MLRLNSHKLVLTILLCIKVFRNNQRHLKQDGMNKKGLEKEMNIFCDPHMGRLKKRDFYHFFWGKGGGQQVHFIFFSLSRNDF